MKTRKTTSILTVLALILALMLPVLSLAETSTPAAPYTLEQMLTAAIQDEYKAQAQYQAAITALQAENRFSNILKAEGTHIALLTALFETHGIALPENTAAGLVTTPATLEEAYALSAKAESENTAMYDSFLAQTDLPEDVRAAFTALKNASQNHYEAFTKDIGAGRNGTGTQYGRGNRRPAATDDMPCLEDGAQRGPRNNRSCRMGGQMGGRMGTQMGGRMNRQNACDGVCDVLIPE